MASVLQASETVPSRDGLFRLRPLAALYRFCPGFFLAAARDPNGSPLSMVIEQCRRRAEADGVMFSRVADAAPFRTAAAALMRFAALLPDKGYDLFISSGGAADRHRKIVAFEDGAALCVPPGCGPADATVALPPNPLSPSLRPLGQAAVAQ